MPEGVEFTDKEKKAWDAQIAKLAKAEKAQAEKEAKEKAKVRAQAMLMPCVSLELAQCTGTTPQASSYAVRCCARAALCC